MTNDGAVPITTFLEEYFGAALTPEFVLSVQTLSADQITDLWHAYNAYGASWTPPPPPGNELWPIVDTFPGSWSYGNSGEFNPAESYLRRTLSQLMYAHGVWFHDTLGQNLAIWTHDKYYGGHSPAWRHEPSRRAFQHYLETLMYLRPLLDRGLVRIYPKPLTEEDIGSSGAGYAAFGDLGRYNALDEIVACEFLFGEKEAALLAASWGKFLAATRESDSVSMERKIGPKASTNYEELTSGTLAAASVSKKLDPARSVYGDLSLDTNMEYRLFNWTHKSVEQKTNTLGADQLRRIQTVAADRIEDLDVKDVLALHDDSRWEDFRLALSRGLERSHAAGQSPDDDAKYLAEEVDAVRRAVKRASAKSSVLDERKRFGRDVVIGMTGYAAFAPIVGNAAAAIGASLATTRSVLTLAWRWLSLRESARSEQRVANCFSALVDHKVDRPAVP